MKGHYSKKEAALILGVSERQVSNYLSSGKLTKSVHGRRVYIPQDEVNRLSGRSTVLADSELRALLSRVDRLEHRVEVLTIGLGFGVRRPTLSDAELVLLRQKVLMLTNRINWPKPTLAETADLMMKLQPDEAMRLTVMYGADALVPVVSLAQQMIVYIERHEDFPGAGFDILRERLIRSRDRLFGLVRTATKITLGVSREEAVKVYQTIDIPPGAIDLHIAEFLTS